MERTNEVPYPYAGVTPMVLTLDRLCTARKIDQIDHIDASVVSSWGIKPDKITHGLRALGLIDPTGNLTGQALAVRKERKIASGPRTQSQQMICQLYGFGLVNDVINADDPTKQAGEYFSQILHEHIAQRAARLLPPLCDWAGMEFKNPFRTRLRSISSGLATTGGVQIVMTYKEAQKLLGNDPGAQDQLDHFIHQRLRAGLNSNRLRVSVQPPLYRLTDSILRKR